MSDFTLTVNGGLDGHKLDSAFQGKLEEVFYPTDLHKITELEEGLCYQML